MAHLTLSAVIPTKNRPGDLRNAVASLLAQTRVPDELLIVDQSAGHESRDLIHGMLDGHPSIALRYIHDTSIRGLVGAKDVAVRHATGAIISFLEDDVVLEPRYIEGVLWGFETNSAMCGCGGIVTNPPHTSGAYVFLQGLFMRGIFRDPRVRLFATLPPSASELIPCDVVSGGLSSWRAEVFRSVSFDVGNGFHMFEDMEFATRVVRELGHCLFINPRARLAHYGSPVNRDEHGERQRRKMAEAMVFYRKRRAWPGAAGGIVCASSWWLAEAVMQSVKLRRAGPLSGYVRGALDGWRRPLA